MELLFDQTKVPRTTTCDAWREMDRWRRTTRKQNQRMLDRLRSFGSIELPAAQQLRDELINPPLLLGPYQ